MGITRRNRERPEYINIAKIIEFVQSGRLDASKVLI
jgi:hypothetical protein